MTATRTSMSPQVNRKAIVVLMTGSMPPSAFFLDREQTDRSMALLGDGQHLSVANRAVMVISAFHPMPWLNHRCYPSVAAVADQSTTTG
jgi:hypothetical protein